MTWFLYQYTQKASQNLLWRCVDGCIDLPSIIQFWSEPSKQCDDVTENQQLLGTRNKKQQQCAISKLKINCSNFSFNNEHMAGQKTNIKSNNFLFRTVTHLLICNHFLRHKICSGEVNKFKWWPHFWSHRLSFFLIHLSQLLQDNRLFG